MAIIQEKIPMNWEQEIESFLLKKSQKPKIIVIYWPTASGKTGLSIEVAQKINSQIISTDSKQIYTGLDIGTGKITQEETQGIIHHMIDIVSPTQKYSVWEFKREAEKHIQNILADSKIPVLCWGTGLYIDSIMYDFDIPSPPDSKQLRAELEAQAQEFWAQSVYQKLQEIDPEYAKELHPNNVQYVIRAIEVKILTGKSKRDFRGNKTSKYDVLFLTPYNGDRAYLYERINTRVGMMFDEWLVAEVEDLLKKYGPNDPGLQTIWYSEVVDHLQWNISLEACIELVQQHNRNYAKRQLTWFSKYTQ